jgi:hypothetical protein
MNAGQPPHSTARSQHHRKFSSFECSVAFHTFSDPAVQYTISGAVQAEGKEREKRGKEGQ